MSLTFKRKETVPAGLHRMAGELLLEASKALDGDCSNEAVHDVRKRLKELRALIRLCERGLGKDVFKREMSCYRKIGRQLSGARDRWVRLQTLQILEDETGGTGPAFQKARETFDRAYRAAQTRSSLNLENVRDTIAKARRRVDEWPLEGGWEIIEAGLGRSYRKGRKGCRNVKGEVHPEAFHDLRKRAKDLRYQLEMLTPVCHEMISPLATMAQTITNELGLANDMAVLQEAIRAEPALYGDKKTVREIVRAAEKRRKRYLQTAIAQCEILYAETPKAFANRLKSYWRSWRGKNA